jgi:membrane-associated phospholipid phosphatase
MNRRMLVWSGVGCLALVFALGALITLGVAHPFVFDAWWNDLVVSLRSDGMIAFAHALDTVGGGWVAVYLVPLVVIIAFLLARRWRSAVFAALAFLASAGAVQLLKHLFGRARPEDMLVLSDYGSFPSGHTANAATLAFVFAVLFPNVWVRVAGAVWHLPVGALGDRYDRRGVARGRGRAPSRSLVAAVGAAPRRGGAARR